jgi:hypothetical protein
MKTLVITLSILLISAAGYVEASGQKPEAEATGIPSLGGNAATPKLCAVSNYAQGLRSDNTGLVESCLFYAVQLRIKKPELDLRKLEKEIDALVAGGATLSIRRKAALASIIFASPALAGSSLTDEQKNIEGFFATLNEQITSRLVVMK